MEYYLYPNFLSDPNEYARAEALWQEYWAELRKEADERDAWTAPWLNSTFADQSQFRDGNPIFSAVSRPYRRGIRVIQLPPSASPRDLDFWTDTFDSDGDDAIEELVISCVLTRGTLIDAASLMRQWVEEGHIDLAYHAGSSETER